ncbi:hypothetical protein GS597_03190 [Synechococcales cyanobacterium C]|uniref:Uncharacterized protein n=1 Tax=Petrachloros mirabilis ULC683 TaxID=2781853 RepID=A0A8K1ZXL0_9CYAN|nr:hypothetical protein [Petrachloros mirabilis]NCJ05527.1 hypothetical protein [Petrachloros mirabilis ULC683]
MNKLFIASAVLASTSACLLAVNSANAQNIAATVTATGSERTLDGGLNLGSQSANLSTTFDNITVGAAVNADGTGSAFSNSTISSTSLQKSIIDEVGGFINRGLKSFHRSNIVSSTAVANSLPLSGFAVAIGLTGEYRSVGVLGVEDIDINVFYDQPSIVPEPAGANIAATVSATGGRGHTSSGEIDLPEQSGQIQAFYDNITVGAAINADGTGSAFSNSTISSASTTHFTTAANDAITDNSVYDSDIASSTAAANPRGINEFFVAIGTFGEGGFFGAQSQSDAGVEGTNDATIVVVYD